MTQCKCDMSLSLFCICFRSSDKNFLWKKFLTNGILSLSQRRRALQPNQLQRYWGLLLIGKQDFLQGWPIRSWLIKSHHCLRLDPPLIVNSLFTYLALCYRSKILNSGDHFEKHISASHILTVFGQSGMFGKRGLEVRCDVTHNLFPARTWAWNKIH